jgi:hypothetical protein
MNLRKLAAASVAALVAWGLAAATPASASPSDAPACDPPSCFSLEDPYGPPVVMRYNADSHVLQACYTPRGLTVQIQVAFTTTDRPLEPQIVNRRAEANSTRSCVVALPQGQNVRVLAVRGCVADVDPGSTEPTCQWTGSTEETYPTLAEFFFVGGDPTPTSADPRNPGPGLECVNDDPDNCWFLV